MNEEERLTLNNYIEDLYQAMQIGDIVFEPKNSSELYNLINKLLQENQQLKEKIQQKEDIINKTIEQLYLKIDKYSKELDYVLNGTDLKEIINMLEKSDK